MRLRSLSSSSMLAVLSLVLACCGGGDDSAAPSAPSSARVGGSDAVRATPAQLLTATDHGLPPELDFLDRAWTGDFDEMAERRMIRLLTVYAKGLYFLDGKEQRGVTYELARQFEQQINDSLRTGNLKVHVVVIPVTRDLLIPALAQGFGDIAAANLTITPERQDLVSFSRPFRTGVDEIVVTGPSSPPLGELDDLAGVEIHVRPSSSYWTSLERLNESLQERGLGPVEMVVAPEHLEDEDLLEMVNAGLLPLAVVDSHKAEFWAQFFEDLELRPDLAVASGGEIAWAFRKDSPRLQAVVDEFVRTHEKGTLMGNVILKHYLDDVRWVERALESDGVELFRGVAPLMQRYAGQYEFDWLMITAQGYQESRLDQSARSAAGAVGIMQLLPSTAADPNVGIPDIENADSNVHAGVKYMRFLRDRYFSGPELDHVNATLFSFAAYNAGPARISRLRSRAEELGLDPHRWFGNVEHVVSMEVGREPVQYVANIYKYYVAYRLVAERLALEGPPAP